MVSLRLPMQASGRGWAAAPETVETVMGEQAQKVLQSRGSHTRQPSAAKMGQRPWQMLARRH